MLLMLLFALSAGFEMDAKFVDGGGESVNSDVLCSDGSNDGRMPAVSRHDERKHGVELLFEAVGAFAVGFVEDEDVRDFHEARFHGLNVVTEAGNENDDDTIGEADDVNFILADADGFDEDLFFACGVQDECDFGSGSRKAAEKTACGHGADEDAGVAGMALHADAIAENGAAGVRAGGIDGDDSDFLAGFAIVSGEAVDERAFAGARSAGDAGEIGGASVRKKNLD